MKRISNFLIAALFIVAASILTASAQNGTAAMKDEMAKPAADKPIVAIIRADWCPYCRKLEPALAKWMTDYQDKITFVVLDITNDKTKAKAREIAKDAGLEKFFDANSEKASLITIFNDKKEVFQTVHNSDPDAYTAAFDKVLEGDK